jgi:hypothetical protein
MIVGRPIRAVRQVGRLPHVNRETEERIARNDAAFRDANERIEQAAAEIGVANGPLPFICECADRECTEIVLLELDEYAAIRANPRWFLAVPGHERRAGGAAKIVESHDGYDVVEKVGHAGEVAERLDTGSRTKGEST